MFDPPPPAGAPPSRRQQLVAAGLIVLAVGFVYWNSLSAPFVFDDVHYIEHNELVRDLSRPDQVISFNPVRALLLLSFAVNHTLSGMSTTGYHLTNCLIHCLNAFLVFQLIACLLLLRPATAEALGRYRELVPLFGALLYAVHPIQTEAVTYIVGRSSSMASLFYLLGLVCFLRASGASGRARTLWTAGMGLVYLLGLATKEIAATLPAVLLLLDWLFLARDSLRERLLKIHLPIWILFWVLVVLRLTLLGKIGNPEHGGLPSSWIYFQTQLAVFPRYLLLLVYPVGLSIDHHVPWLNNPFEPNVLLGAGLILALLAVLFLGRRNPFLAFGLGFFLLALTPTSTLLPIRDAMVERRLYLPLVGLMLPASVGLAWLTAWLERRFPRRPLGAVTAIAAAGLLVVLANLAMIRNADYSSRLTLWESALAMAPGKARAHVNLALARYEELNDRYTARMLLEHALELEPENMKAHNILGVLAALEGDWSRSELHLTRAVELTETYADPYKNLALLYAYTGRCAKARELLEQYESRKIPPGADEDGRSRVAGCLDGKIKLPSKNDFR